MNDVVRNLTLVAANLADGGASVEVGVLAGGGQNNSAQVGVHDAVSIQPSHAANVAVPVLEVTVLSAGSSLGLNVLHRVHDLAGLAAQVAIHVASVVILVSASLHGGSSDAVGTYLVGSSQGDAVGGLGKGDGVDLLLHSEGQTGIGQSVIPQLVTVGAGGVDDQRGHTGEGDDDLRTLVQTDRSAVVTHVVGRLALVVDQHQTVVLPLLALGTELSALSLVRVEGDGRLQRQLGAAGGADAVHIVVGDHGDLLAIAVAARGASISLGAGSGTGSIDDGLTVAVTQSRALNSAADGAGLGLGAGGINPVVCALIVALFLGGGGHAVGTHLSGGGQGDAVHRSSKGDGVDTTLNSVGQTGRFQGSSPGIAVLTGGGVDDQLGHAGIRDDDLGTLVETSRVGVVTHVGGGATLVVGQHQTVALPHLNGGGVLGALIQSGEVQGILGHVGLLFDFAGVAATVVAVGIPLVVKVVLQSGNVVAAVDAQTVDTGVLSVGHALSLTLALAAQLAGGGALELILVLAAAGGLDEVAVLHLSGAVVVTDDTIHFDGHTGLGLLGHGIVAGAVAIIQTVHGEGVLAIGDVQVTIGGVIHLGDLTGDVVFALGVAVVANANAQSDRLSDSQLAVSSGHIDLTLSKANVALRIIDAAVHVVGIVGVSGATTVLALSGAVVGELVLLGVLAALGAGVAADQIVVVAVGVTGRADYVGDGVDHGTIAAGNGGQGDGLVAGGVDDNLVIGAIVGSIGQGVSSAIDVQLGGVRLVLTHSDDDRGHIGRNGKAKAAGLAAGTQLDTAVTLSVAGRAVHVVQTIQSEGVVTDSFGVGGVLVTIGMSGSAISAHGKDDGSVCGKDSHRQRATQHQSHSQNRHNFLHGLHCFGFLLKYFGSLQ